MSAWIEHRDPETWNALVTKFPITSAFQCWEWGEVKRLTGWEPVRLELPNVAALQILRRRLAPRLTILYAPRGPALRDLDRLPSVAITLRRFARTDDVYLKIEPERNLPVDSPAPHASGGFRPAESVQPSHSVLIDLTASPEAILERMHSRARSYVRSSLAAGVEVRVEHDLSAFWPLFQATNQRAGLFAFEARYYETLLRLLVGEAGGAEAHVLTAYHEDEPLATALCLTFRERVYYLYGGSSRARDRVRPSYGLQWGILRWARERGHATYDLFGVPKTVVPEAHAHGVARFKLRLGGMRIRNDGYDLPLSPLYTPLRAAVRLRKSWVNLRATGRVEDIV